MTNRALSLLFGTQRRIGLTTMAVALVTAIAGLVLASREKVKQENDAEIYRIRGLFNAEEMAKKLNDLQQQVEKNRVTTNALTLAMKSQDFTHANFKGLGMRPEERRELSQAEETQKQLLDRMTALESALVNSPEKALALPLLGQQLSDTQDRFKSDMDETHAEFGRIYTLVQWALGLIITIILGMGGFLIARKTDGDAVHKKSPEPET